MPAEIGGMVMIFGDQFAMESGRSRKLQQRWRGPFIVIEFDEHTRNYAVSMDSRIYRRQKGVFHCSVANPTTLTMMNDSLEGPTPSRHLS